MSRPSHQGQVAYSAAVRKIQDKTKFRPPRDCGSCCSPSILLRARSPDSSLQSSSRTCMDKVLIRLQEQRTIYFFLNSKKNEKHCRKSSLKYHKKTCDLHWLQLSLIAKNINQCSESHLLRQDQTTKTILLSTCKNVDGEMNCGLNRKVLIKSNVIN